MATPRQQARVQINRILDEMIAELHKIRRFTLHMDKLTLMTIGKRITHQFNQMMAILNVLEDVSLPHEEVITSDEELPGFDELSK